MRNRAKVAHWTSAESHWTWQPGSRAFSLPSSSVWPVFCFTPTEIQVSQLNWETRCFALVKNMDFAIQNARNQILVPLLYSCVTWGKLLDFSVLPFPRLQNGNNSTYFLGLLRRWVSARKVLIWHMLVLTVTTISSLLCPASLALNNFIMC